MDPPIDITTIKLNLFNGICLLFICEMDNYSFRLWLKLPACMGGVWLWLTTSHADEYNHIDTIINEDDTCEHIAYN